jgi:hypothetical protein
MSLTDHMIAVKPRLTCSMTASSPSGLSDGSEEICDAAAWIISSLHVQRLDRCAKGARFDKHATRAQMPVRINALAVGTMLITPTPPAMPSPPSDRERPNL